MELSELIFRAGLILALSLIIGFQRQHSTVPVAGIRTFPLLGLAGFICGLLSIKLAGWIVAAGIVGLAIFFLIGFLKEKMAGQINYGITTEVAALVVFLIGVFLAVDERPEFAVVVGGITALLLFWRQAMHNLVAQAEQKDVRAIMHFVLIAFVIMPLLPNRDFDAYGVLNPREIWMMVVLITGISLISYAIQRMYQSRTGLLWAGILGGLISSTATTVTYSRISKQHKDSYAFVAALVIASCVAMIRIFLEVLFVSPGSVGKLWPPLLMVFIIMLGLSYLAYKKSKKSGPQEPIRVEDPSQVKAALAFGFLYSIVLFVSAWAKDTFGDEGLYALSVISGFMDVDAMVISAAQLIERNQVTASTGWRLVVLAALSNLVFKMGIAVVMGSGLVRRRVPLYFGLTIVGGSIVLALWP